jgi:hypothetical protein
MALDSYSALQASILSWLARPADPLVQPAVPDMIRLFEAEANRRLKSAGAEKIVSLSATGTNAISLPTDCVQVRQVAIGDLTLDYLPPTQLAGNGGQTNSYSIVGRDLWLGPGTNGEQIVNLVYQSGVPPLSDTAPTNWLLDTAPDAYLFGALVEAEVYIGEDQRAQGWLARREAAFAGLEAADRKLRWAGPLQIRVDTGAGTAGVIGGVTVATIQVSTIFREVSPVSGDTVAMFAREPGLYIAGPLHAALTIRLPPDPVHGMVVDISFENPVTSLQIQYASGSPTLAEPTNGYGPGAGMQFRFVDDVWIYWK